MHFHFDVATTSRYGQIWLTCEVVNFCQCWQSEQNFSLRSTTSQKKTRYCPRPRLLSCCKCQASLRMSCPESLSTGREKLRKKERKPRDTVISNSSNSSRLVRNQSVYNSTKNQKFSAQRQKPELKKTQLERNSGKKDKFEIKQGPL